MCDVELADYCEVLKIMVQTNEPGQIVILNGVPRSGKSSIVATMGFMAAGLALTNLLFLVLGGR